MEHLVITKGRFIMQYRHASKILKRIDEELNYSGGYSASLVRSFRKKMQVIRAAQNENEFRNLKGLHYEKLSGKRKHQRSMRLNDQFRLILEIETAPEGTLIAVIDIEDYH